MRSVCRVAGPSSPTLRDLRTEDSTSWGANLRFSLAGRGVGGDSDRGDGLGVSSGAGPVFRYCSKVVSMGTGANRRRGSVGLAIPGGPARGRECVSITTVLCSVKA